ncbi:N-formylglutamate amidohydrolase [Planctomicrobium sp. SH664]|uniref:N-formylglutamate amidohydrolase n=1 Tax=Planctomicrobium sp. SH664 TaxID=3448125 RepID=UPI003F5C5D69
MSRQRPLQLVITCEHGGNEIPSAYRTAFRAAREALNSHRGHDPGALALAQLLANTFQAPLCSETVSRLLIELNRSPGHPRLFSEFSRVLPADVRQSLVETFYTPYRERVEATIRRSLKAGPVLHVSVHSFTPVMNEKTRRTDIGLLFDPARELESAICRHWRKTLQGELPDHKIHFNLPYRGTSDGFTVTLRKMFADRDYAGIEIEVNQKFPLGNRGEWNWIQRGICESLGTLLTTWQKSDRPAASR